MLLDLIFHSCIVLADIFYGLKSNIMYLMCKPSVSSPLHFHIHLSYHGKHLSVVILSIRGEHILLTKAHKEQLICIVKLQGRSSAQLST